MAAWHPYDQLGCTRGEINIKVEGMKVSLPGLSAAPLSAVKCPSEVSQVQLVSVTEALLLIEENIL